MPVKGKRNGAPSPGRQTGPKPAQGAKKVARRLPGMEGNSIPAIDEAGASLIAAQDDKKKAASAEKSANAAVVAVMKKHKRDYYRYDELEVWVEPGNLKAKAKHVAKKAEK